MNSSAAVGQRRICQRIGAASARSLQTFNFISHVLANQGAGSFESHVKARTFMAALTANPELNAAASRRALD